MTTKVIVDHICGNSGSVPTLTPGCDLGVSASFGMWSNSTDAAGVIWFVPLGEGVNQQSVGGSFNNAMTCSFQNVYDTPPFVTLSPANFNALLTGNGPAFVPQDQVTTSSFVIIGNGSYSQNALYCYRYQVAQ